MSHALPRHLPDTTLTPFAALALAAVYGLYVSPEFGGLLNLMSYGLLPSFVLYVAVSVLAIEASRGYVPRALIAVPIAFYAAFLWTVLESRWAAADMDAAFRAHNQSKVLGHAGLPPSLVFERTMPNVDHTLPLALLLVYDTDVVFTADDKGAGTEALRILPKAACLAQAQAPKQRRKGRIVMWLSSAGTDDRAHCVLASREAPSAPMVFVAIDRVEDSISPVLPYQHDTIEVRAPATAERLTLKAGHAVPLPVIPLPTFRCVTEKMRAVAAVQGQDFPEGCRFDFIRFSPRGLGATTSGMTATLPVLAHALGLKARRQAFAVDATSAGRLAPISPAISSSLKPAGR